MAITVAIVKARDAIVQAITSNAQLWAHLQKTHTMLRREANGRLWYTSNRWLDVIKPTHEKAELAAFKNLIEAIDTHLMHALSGTNANKGKAVYKQWLSSEAKKVNRPN